MKILTGYPVTIDFSVPVATTLIEAVRRCKRPYQDTRNESAVCELENFENLLHNLIERGGFAPSVTITDNSDLV